MSEPGDGVVRSERKEIPAVPKVLQPHPITVRSVDGQPAVFIAEIDGREVGRVSVTIMPLVHDMEIQGGILQRKIADALLFYAQGKVKASGFKEALLFVANENAAMRRYVETRAIPENPSQIYVMAVQ